MINPKPYFLLNRILHRILDQKSCEELILEAQIKVKEFCTGIGYLELYDVKIYSVPIQNILDFFFDRDYISEKQKEILIKFLMRSRRLGDIKL